MNQCGRYLADPFSSISILIHLLANPLKWKKIKKSKILMETRYQNSYPLYNLTWSTLGLLLLHYIDIDIVSYAKCVLGLDRNG